LPPASSTVHDFLVDQDKDYADSWEYDSLTTRIPPSLPATSPQPIPAGGYGGSFDDTMYLSKFGFSGNNCKEQRLNKYPVDFVIPDWDCEEIVRDMIEYYAVEVKYSFLFFIFILFFSILHVSQNFAESISFFLVKLIYIRVIFKCVSLYF